MTPKYPQYFPHHPHHGPCQELRRAVEGQREHRAALGQVIQVFAETVQSRAEDWGFTRPGKLIVCD